MSEVQHTPEPWEVSHEWMGRPKLTIRNVLGKNPGDGAHQICQINGYLGATEANARRIVACVNACRGIGIEVLEDEIFALRFRNYDQLIRERDEARHWIKYLEEVCRMANIPEIIIERGLRTGDITDADLTWASETTATKETT
jgi:hypothetical protein